MEVTVRNGEELLIFLASNPKLSVKQMVSIVSAFSEAPVFADNGCTRSNVLWFVENNKDNMVRGELPLFI